jgi:ribosomal protein L11 methyltransferase
LNSSSLQLTIDVPEILKDAVIGELSECGPAGLWERGEPVPGITRIEIYFTSSAQLQDAEFRVRQIFERGNLPAPSVSIAEVAERDWLGEWKKSWVSFPIGRGFFIVPSWSESACPPERAPIYIDPGQAFGTGTHETTQLTMEFLETMPSRLGSSRQIFDLGIGSGILAIAAHLLGFRRIAGCDIDADSVGVAVENIERNADRGVAVYCGSIDAVQTQSVDLLLCNLTADVIVQLFGEIVRAVRPAGFAILSGILVEQREQVRGAFAGAGWQIVDDRTLGEWIALVIRKPA